MSLPSAFAIGGAIGFVLAAVITQYPFVEKVVTPYILLLVTTPMLALVPLLILRFGFGSEPRIIAVGAGLRADGDDQFGDRVPPRRSREDRARPLLRRFNISDLHQDPHPMAMPMIIVGLMVGSIFGLLTTIGAEMVGGAEGLGNRLTYYSALIRMPQVLRDHPHPRRHGISIYVFFFWVGRKWASWEA